MAWASTARSTRTLVGGCLGDPLDLEGLHAGRGVVCPFFGPTAVDDVADTGDGEGCFGDVGGNDDEAVTLGWGLKDAKLGVVGQERIEGEDVNGRYTLALIVQYWHVDW